MKSQEDGFIRIRINGVHIYSCYIPPSVPQKDFKRILDRLANDAKVRNPKAIAGDFNAWAVEWGSKRMDKRVQELLETLSVLNFILLNDGKTPIYIKGEANFIIDFTFVSSDLIKNNARWRVTDNYTHSDHTVLSCGSLQGS